MYSQVRRGLLVLASIILFYLSMPGGPFPWLVWLAFSPVLLAIYGLKPLQAAGLFLFTSSTCILLVMWWLMPAAINFTGLPALPAFFILLLLALIIALPYALLGGLIVYKNWLDRPLGIVWVSAAFVVLISFYPSSLPGNYAHSLYTEPEFLQLLAIGGLPLLLFCVVAVNGAFTYCFLAKRKDKKQWLLFGVGGICVLGLLWLFGTWQINQSVPQASAEQLKIGFIQPKLIREDSLGRLYRMTEELVADNPDIDLLLWPEFPTEFSYLEDPYDKRNVDRLIRRLDKPLLFVSGYTYAGAAEGESESKRTAESAQVPKPYFNTAHFLDDKAQLLASYDKQVLVPFFEYIPYEAIFPFLRALFPGTYQYVPGSTSKTIRFNEHINLVPLICYETVFPDLVHPFVESGGNIMINLTNDIWLGETDGSKYHFAMGMFRAVEHGMPWVRATNSGVSGVVSATGVIDPETLTPVMSQAAKVATVMVPQQRTLYSYMGDIFLYLLCGVFMIGLILPSRGVRLSS